MESLLSMIFLERAEAREEDAEGMLRPKPEEQPMPKLCEAWATESRRFLRTGRKQSGRTELTRSVNEHERRTGADRGTGRNRQHYFLWAVLIRKEERITVSIHSALVDSPNRLVQDVRGIMSLDIPDSTPSEDISYLRENYIWRSCFGKALR